MTSVSLGTVIYTSIKPFIKIYTILGLGFYLGRTELMNPFFTKNLSDLVISVFFPCLVFEKIISNLQSNNIREIGIIALVSLLYFGMGGLGGVASYYFGGKPKYWKGGCISVGILPNISDLPIAYLSTFASGLMFSEQQGEKGIAYICIFTLFQVMIQFNFGIFKLIGKDYNDQIRDEAGDMEKEKQETFSPSESSQTIPTNAETPSNDIESLDSMPDNLDPTASNIPRIYTTALDTTRIARKHTNASNSSQNTGLSTQQSILSNILGDPTHNTNQLVEVYSHQVVNASNNAVDFDSYSIHPKTKKHEPKLFAKIPHHLKAFLLFMLDNLKKPVSAALVISVVIAMIPWVRALFVVSNQVHIHTAPDGQPPLSFIIDTTTYLGNASIPCGLLLLGATLSRLNIGEMPRFFWVTPLLLSIMRLIILPIIGCLIVWGLKKAHWFENDDVLLFVCLIVWGVPNATSIIYISAYYAPLEDPEGKFKQLNYLSLCYVFQYAVLFITLPFLCTFVSKVILGY